MIKMTALEAAHEAALESAEAALKSYMKAVEAAKAVKACLPGEMKKDEN